MLNRKEGVLSLNFSVISMRVALCFSYQSEVQKLFRKVLLNN